MKKVMLCAATLAAAFTFTVQARAVEQYGSPRAFDARPRVIASTGVKDPNLLAEWPKGNSRSFASHPVVAGSSQGDTDTLAMIRNCPLPPKLKGDTVQCKTCCKTMTCCTASTMK